MTYEFPPYDGPQSHRLAKFRGQRQKWFALRFTGDEREIDPLTPRNGQPAEFDTWRWERLDRVADLVVPFRREVYRTVAQPFARLCLSALFDAFSSREPMPTSLVRRQRSRSHYGLGGGVKLIGFFGVRARDSPKPRL